MTSSDDDFKKLSLEVVKNSKFNNKFSLSDYFKNEAQIEPPKPKETDGDRPTGVGNTETTVRFNNGKQIVMSDYYDHFISPPFNKLVQLTKEKGTYKEHKEGDFPFPSIDDVPKKSK